ncbi:MAG: PfkB family carbohydrate kinase [Gemmatimonadales bacterium]
MPRVGVIGSLVWDEIHGRDPALPVVEEWGGIAYALAGLDAHLEQGWEIVPLIKVGSDLGSQAAELLGTLRRVAAGSRFIEVPVPNNRVVLRYESTERRCERMAGGVPAWTWTELGPMVRDLDAVYVNFISGFEMCLGTAEALRHGFDGTVYADLHSLLLGMHGDGMRRLQPLSDAPSWFRCFDVIQVNEEEMRQLGPDPLTLAAAMLEGGVTALIVTLGPRGVIYVTAEGQTAGRPEGRRGVSGTARTALVPVQPGDPALDPTGCGDVFGATTFARLLAGEHLEAAIVTGARAAARNAAFRGATGLAAHLRGELVTP